MLEDGVEVPAELRCARFVATPLTGELAARDYAAYLASPEVIAVHSDGRWPVAGFTLTEDLDLVARHASDHAARRAFTFVLLDPSSTDALGCLYLNPLRDYLQRAAAGPDLLGSVGPSAAMVTFWLRQDQQDTGLAEVVVEAVGSWLRDDWAFTTCWWRILPGERSSRRALERSALHRFAPTLPGETRPYLWYRPG